MRRYSHQCFFLLFSNNNSETNVNNSFYKSNYTQTKNLGVEFETGTDVAGEVLEVGAGVKSLKAGDKVVTFLNHAVSTHSHPFPLLIFLINHDQDNFLAIDINCKFLFYISPNLGYFFFLSALKYSLALLNVIEEVKFC